MHKDGAAEEEQARSERQVAEMCHNDMCDYRRPSNVLFANDNHRTTSPITL